MAISVLQDGPAHARRRFLAASAASLCCAAAGRRAFGASTLTQATILVGSPPGGATDKLARMFADGLGRRYADRVIVENKAGAGGAIAYAHVKHSGVKDGSLMFLSPAYPIVISPHVVSTLPYDPLRDFAPVGIAGRSMMTIAVGPAVPAEVRTLEDYVRWCREHPGQALYAAQTGSSQHLVGTSFSQAANVKLDNVSYKGDAPALQDLLGGHVPAIILPIASAIPQHQSGGIRVLAVTGAKRSRFLPDIPTTGELGYKDIVFQDWLGVFMVARTPQAVLERMNRAMNEVSGSEQGQQALANLGFEPVQVTTEVFAGMVKADYERYRGIIERTRFREVFEKSVGR
ncbi:MAG: tripartite tricarboxylate transporter substrate-binding protein [Pigmentiphaga sp.]|uniref:tripartite tricarboxylate transporter substrate-binding protein n=1 Tax=Pigmentiphaga sp. TaxID=1977564 RepID=UPI0029BEFA7D|nr:tripartite tricarboxylate transporter substrate-binding protein [Pigmentiphaga sp.]MDX3905929.1 tripartite tricarboxylate transporter substrate-binding protein [Pigmentiphaga sp.]